MSSPRWINPLRDFIDRFFDEDILPSRFFGDFYYSGTDVYENDKYVVIETQVPGFKKENIKISFNKEGYLKIEGKITEKEEEKNKNYFKKGIKKESFMKVIPIPKEVDFKKAEAMLEDGVLKVFLPKIEQSESFGEEILIK